MAKTYTLTATEMHCGRSSTWTNADWRNYVLNDSIGLKAGYYQSNYRATNILFNATTLATLRSKTVTSIKLTLTFEHDVTIPSSGTTQYPIGYKLDTSTTASDSWRRSDADSTAFSTTDTAGFVRTTGSSQVVTAGGTYTFDLSDGKVPKYGYVLGTVYTNTSAYYTISAATLTVVTNETDYSYTLAYNANGGSGAPSNQTGSNTGTSPSYTFTISSTRPTRSNYTFLGWSKSSTATSASYSPSGSITVTASGTTTLYAVWQANYTLAYNANGGSGAPANQTGTSVGTSISYTFTISSTRPTRANYNFLGWSQADDATSPSFSPGDSFTVTAVGTTTLYAVWESSEPVGTSSVYVFDGTDCIGGMVYVDYNGAMVEGTVWVKYNGEMVRIT